MSWIVEDLWRTLEARRSNYEDGLRERKLRAFTIINNIASEVGSKWRVLIQINFPPGTVIPEPRRLGHRDLSILVYRERKKFEGITENELRDHLQSMKPISIDATGRGYEGLKAALGPGRIDCLPGGVHLWCDISPQVLDFLDWLFENAYQRSRPVT